MGRFLRGKDGKPETLKDPYEYIDNNVPSNDAGSIGDKAGDIAFDSDGLYWCYRNFPRQTDYEIEVRVSRSANDFEITVLSADFPNDIYEGFDIRNSDGSSLTYSVGISTTGTYTTINANISRFWQAGEIYILRYNSRVEIWRKAEKSNTNWNT